MTKESDSRVVTRTVGVSKDQIKRGLCHMRTAYPSTGKRPMSQTTAEVLVNSSVLLVSFEPASGYQPSSQLNIKY
jgi:hypothetical protein